MIDGIGPAPPPPFVPGALGGPASIADYVPVHLLLVPAVLVAVAWTLQHGPLDMRIAALFFDPKRGFVGHHLPWLDILGHEAARSLPILVGALSVAAGAAARWRPLWRPWRPILFSIGAAMLAGPLAIAVMKSMTSQHCPTDTLEFGGIVAHALDQAAPFWAATRQAAGRCLPSGHAGGGYALLCLYFAGWAAGRPAWRWGGLAVGVSAGLVFSVVRMMQGAHFASATIWSAAIDWLVCALIFMPLLCRKSPPRN
ncbi:MAG TPA: phosphatase PAP2 family protein [Caldimonas sp.]|nr:phosphatase PAP2 family protein [Caldimonas sp.]